MEKHTIEECPQAPYIANIHETLKRVVDALEKVVSTNVRVDYIEAENRALKAENENLFARMREMEMLIGKDGNGYKVEIMEAMTATKEEITASVAASMGEVKKSIDESLKNLSTSVSTTVSFVTTLRSKKAVYAFTIIAFMIVSGFACDIVYHRDLFVRTWELMEKIKKGI